jgi:hypothetical protein
VRLVVAGLLGVFLALGVVALMFPPLLIFAVMAIGRFQ